MPELSDGDKLKAFDAEAMRMAKNEADAILNAVAAAREKKLTDGKRAVDAETDESLDAGLKSMRRANAKIFAAESTKLREKLLLGRESVIDEILERVRELLAEFVKSPEYRDYLLKRCLEVVKRRGESFTIYLSEADALEYKYPILRALDDYQESVAEAVGYTEQLAPVYTVLPDNTIKIGGVKLLSSEGGVFINETLDENLRLAGERLSKSGKLTAVETDGGLREEKTQ